MSTIPYPDRIKRVRKALGETQEQFSRRFGRSSGTAAGLWEMGKRQAPYSVLMFIEAYLRDHPDSQPSDMDLNPYGGDTALKSISERDLEPQDDGQYSRGEKNDRHRGSDKSPEFRAEIKP